MHSQALCINYAFETLGVFLGNHFPAGEEKLTSFRNKLEISLIPMEKYNFEITKEMKTNELSSVEGYGIVKSGDLGPDGQFRCHKPPTGGHAL